jgi:hypothetical protein
MTNADVVSMVKAGLAETTIILAVQHSPTNFDTSPQELIRLKNAGVGQKVLDAMLTASSSAAGQAAQAPGDDRGSSSPRSSRGVNGDKWQVTEERSAMDDSLTVALTLDAEERITGPVREQQPTLIIRCKEGKTSVYIWTGMAADVEYGNERHTVRVRLNNGTAVTEEWSESTSRDGLFAPDAISFAKQLATASTLAFEFRPFDSGPVTARFDTRGLNTHLGKVASACGWELPSETRSGSSNNPASSETNLPSSNATSDDAGRSLIAKVASAFGGRDSLAKLQATFYRLKQHIRMPEGTKMPDGKSELDLESEVTRVYPDRVAVVMHSMPTGQPLGKMVVTGSSGFQLLPGGFSRELPSLEVTKTLRTVTQSLLYIAQHADDPSFAFNLKGAEDVGGLHTSVLQVSAGENQVRWNISDDGRVVRATSTEGTEEFSDWRHADGFLVPFTIVQRGAANATVNIQVEEFRANPTIDAALFAKPSGTPALPAPAGTPQAQTASSPVSAACPIELLKVDPRAYPFGTLGPCCELQIKYRNTSGKTIVGTKFSAAFFDATNDRHESAWSYTADDVVQPGEKKGPHWSDSVYFDEIGYGIRAEAWLVKVRYSDGTTWEDDGSRACKRASWEKESK